MIMYYRLKPAAGRVAKRYSPLLPSVPLKKDTGGIHTTAGSTYPAAGYSNHYYYLAITGVA